jgi:ribulose-bisphosphate carboxylase small chain
MRVTQGTFSYLPDLSQDQVERQLAYALSRGWALSVEHTDDPHPRNTYWELWGEPMFDLDRPAEALAALEACRRAHPDRYVKVSAFDASRGWETVRLSFLVQRPPVEPTFELLRQEASGQPSWSLRTRPAP